MEGMVMEQAFIQDENIISKIYLIRGCKVMLDSDLAALYGVATKVFNQSVKRSLNRFPHDFMFRLSEQEYEDLRSQFVTSKRGGRRYLPLAFTEQGVAMLSSILNSERAIAVNIRIIRVFTRLREVLLHNQDLLLRLEQLDKKIINMGMDLRAHNGAIETLFELIQEWRMTQEDAPRAPIGFPTKSAGKE